MLGLTKRVGTKTLALTRRQVGAWREGAALRCWLRARSREDTHIHPSIYFEGVNPPFPHLHFGRGSNLDREVTIWISADQGAEPELTLKDKIFIGRHTCIGVYKPITIGNFVMIGAYSYLTSGNHRFDRTDVPIRDQGFVGASIVLEDDVWLGTHVVVLPGVTIGQGSVIGAGSLVTKSVPSNQIWGGVPARFIKVRG